MLPSSSQQRKTIALFSKFDQAFHEKSRYSVFIDSLPGVAGKGAGLTSSAEEAGLFVDDARQADMAAHCRTGQMSPGSNHHCLGFEWEVDSRPSGS